MSGDGTESHSFSQWWAKYAQKGRELRYYGYIYASRIIWTGFKEKNVRLQTQIDWIIFHFIFAGIAVVCPVFTITTLTSLSFSSPA